MQYSSYLLGLSALLTTTTALGINCRGSGLCPRASWNNKASESVIQVLRNAIYTSKDPTSVSFANGQHIICVSQNQPVTVGGSVSAGGSSGGGSEGGATGTASASGTFSLTGSIGEGGICLFPQGMADGATISLAQIRPLTDALLEHGCSTCGSVPIHFVDQVSFGRIISFPDLPLLPPTQKRRTKNMNMQVLTQPFSPTYRKATAPTAAF